MNKTLLVLAASTYQIPIIKKALQLGYRVITADNLAENPGHRLANQSYVVSNTDVNAVLEIAYKESISGVIAPGTDVAVYTAAVVANNLGLPGPTPEAARILTNKLYFRNFQASQGLSHPKFYEINDENNFLFTKSWLIKPCQSSGSKGVFVVSDAHAFNNCLAESQSYSIDKKAILEEFLDGTQHTCEGILKDGKIELHLITDRDTAIPPYTTTIGHRAPSNLSKSMQMQAIAVIEKTIGQLNITSGPFDCDFVALDDTVTLIEITPRLGGNSLSALFKIAMDFDLVAYAIAYACGDQINLPTNCAPKPTAICLLGADQEGNIFWNRDEVDLLNNESWIKSLTLDYPINTYVEPFMNGRNRIGEVLIQTLSRGELDLRIAELYRRLALKANCPK